MANEPNDGPSSVVAPPLGGYAAKLCARRAHNDFDPDIPSELRDEDSEAALMRMEEGNTFESEIAAVLAGVLDPDDAVFLTGDRSGASLDAREAATAQAMADGVRFIWNPRFAPQRSASRTGEPDALARYGDAPKANGKWAYVGVDVKHHRSFEGTKAPRTWKASPLASPWLASGADLEAAGTPQLVDSMQLAHYHRMLEGVGHEGPAIGGIIGKPIGGELMVLWRPLDEALYLHDNADGVREAMSALAIYDLEFGYRVAVVTRALERAVDPTLAPLAEPELKPECGECPWRTVCHDDLVASDHVTLLQGVTVARARAHYANGISTVGDLARLHWPTAVAVDAKLNVPAIIEAAVTSSQPDAPSSVLVPGNVLKNGKSVTALEALERAGVLTVADAAHLDARTAGYAGHGLTNLAASIDQARVVKANRVHRARGVEHVSMPRSAVELDVDMENDESIYLWGVKVTIRSRGTVRSEYKPFVSWDGTAAGEAKAFAEFWAFMMATRLWARESHVGGFKAFYYTQAETRCMRAIVERHAGREGIPSSEDLEAFIASDDWVDMHQIIAGQMLWPTEDMSIKSIAKLCRHMWRDEQAGGGNSVSWYRDAVWGPTQAVRDENQTRVLEYNEDDVEATFKVREWISELGEARRPGKKLPSVAALDARFGRPIVPRATRPAVAA